MKLSINQSELQNALSIVSKGISTRSTLPILSGVHFKASGDTLILQTTDLELSIRFSVNALIEEEGETVIPVKLFLEIIKNLPEAAVSLETIGESIIITCDTSSFTLKTLPAQDFPGFPSVDIQQTITLPFARFSSMAKRVVKVASKDESRAILTGILISVEDNHLKMVATDSYRLSITETDIEENNGVDPFKAVIAANFIQDIITLPKVDDMINFSLSENQIVVNYQETTFINRRIEGNFPNYNQLLPESLSTKVIFDTQKLISAVKRISLLNTQSTPIKLDINVDSQIVKISSTEQDIGSAQEIISCEVTGEDVEIAFNYSYVLDGLMVVNSEQITLEVLSSMKPGVFKSASDENYLYLVMPVRIA